MRPLQDATAADSRALMPDRQAVGVGPVAVDLHMVLIVWVWPATKKLEKTTKQSFTAKDGLTVLRFCETAIEHQC